MILYLYNKCLKMKYYNTNQLIEINIQYKQKHKMKQKKQITYDIIIIKSQFFYKFMIYNSNLNKYII